jgi:Family of unknown function (DUF6525)
VSNRSRRINLEKDFDKLPKSVRRALNDCVWNWAADNVTVAWAPAKQLVLRIRLADQLACTGSNLEDKPDPADGARIMYILRGF